MSSIPGFVPMDADELQTIVRARDICELKSTELLGDRSSAIAAAAGATLISLLRYTALVPENQAADN